MPTQTGSIDLKALKEAGGLAVDAQESVDNLQIGGRNLIVGTLYPKTDSTERPHLHGQVVNTAGRGTCTTAEHGIKFTSTTANWQYIRFGTSVASSASSMLGLEAGETYTLSADLAWNVMSSTTGKANATTYYMGSYLYYSTSKTGSYSLADGNYQIPITQADKGTDMTGRLLHTFTVPANAVKLYLDIKTDNSTGSHYAVGDWLEARNLKLEKGGKATDWTPAPEDLQAETEEAKKVATNYVTDLTGNDGILVHRENDANSGLKLTDKVQILRNGEVVAEFGANAGMTVILGVPSSGQMEIDNMGITGTDSTGQEMLAIRKSGATVTDLISRRIDGAVLTAVNETDTYTLPTIGTAAEFEISVNLNDGARWVRHTFTEGTAETHTFSLVGVAGSLVYDGSETITLTATTVPDGASMALIWIRYQTTNEAPYYNLGSRAGEPGGYSAIIGSGLYATNQYQAAFGRFNTAPGQHDSFVIGNGTDDDNRSDLFKITDYGDVGMYVDLANLDDYKIQLDAYNLGWTTTPGIPTFWQDGINWLKTFIGYTVSQFLKYGTFKFSNDTVINSGSQTDVSLPTNSTHLMVVTSGGTAQRGMYMVTCTSTDATTSTAFHNISSLTITTGTGKITVKNTGSQPVRLNFLTLQGDQV